MHKPPEREPVPPDLGSRRRANSSSQRRCAGGRARRPRARRCRAASARPSRRPHEAARARVGSSRPQSFRVIDREHPILGVLQFVAGSPAKTKQIPPSTSRNTVFVVPDSTTVSMLSRTSTVATIVTRKPIQKMRSRNLFGGGAGASARGAVRWRRRRAAGAAAWGGGCNRLRRVPGPAAARRPVPPVRPRPRASARPRRRAVALLLERDACRAHVAAGSARHWLLLAHCARSVTGVPADARIAPGPPHPSNGGFSLDHLNGGCSTRRKPFISRACSGSEKHPAEVVDEEVKHGVSLVAVLGAVWSRRSGRLQASRRAPTDHSGSRPTRSPRTGTLWSAPRGSTGKGLT